MNAYEQHTKTDGYEMHAEDHFHPSGEHVFGLLYKDNTRPMHRGGLYVDISDGHLYVKTPKITEQTWTLVDVLTVKQLRHTAEILTMAADAQEEHENSPLGKALQHYEALTEDEKYAFHNLRSSLTP